MLDSVWKRLVPAAMALSFTSKPMAVPAGPCDEDIYIYSTWCIYYNE